MGASIYAFNEAMENIVFTNADAEMLFIPENESILLFTEMGKMSVSPGEIAIVPRGMMVKISSDKPCEVISAKTMELSSHCLRGDQ